MARVSWRLVRAFGKSVMEAGESIVVAIVADVADDIVMDVQMDCESVVDARESVVDAVYADAAVVGVHMVSRRATVAIVMEAFVLDAGTTTITPCMQDILLQNLFQTFNA
jgi:hypothetical protein